MKDDHETFLNRFIALGGAVKYFLDRCDYDCGDGEKCHEIVKRSNQMTETFRNMPRWKKWLFNRLVR